MRRTAISDLLGSSPWSGHVWVVESKTLYCKDPDWRSPRANEWLKAIRPANVASAHADGNFREDPDIHTIDVVARPKLDVSSTPKDLYWAWTMERIAEECSKKYSCYIFAHGWNYHVRLDGDEEIGASLIPSLTAVKTTRNLFMKYLELDLKPLHDERHAKFTKWFEDEKARRGRPPGYDTLLPQEK